MNPATRAPALLLALLLLGARGALAQTPDPCAALAPVVAAADSLRGDSAAGRPDVVIRASVSARELRFESEPRARVRLTGCTPGDSARVRVLERRNLPERVQPGVTYRDVYVAVEIVGRLEAACLLGLAADSAAARGRPLPCAPAARDTASRAPPPPPRP